jgi:hypothetical protein
VVTSFWAGTAGVLFKDRISLQRLDNDSLPEYLAKSGKPYFVLQDEAGVPFPVHIYSDITLTHTSNLCRSQLYHLPLHSQTVLEGDSIVKGEFGLLFLFKVLFDLY